MDETLFEGEVFVAKEEMETTDFLYIWLIYCWSIEAQKCKGLSVQVEVQQFRLNAIYEYDQIYAF